MTQTYANPFLYRLRDCEVASCTTLVNLFQVDSLIDSYVLPHRLHFLCSEAGLQRPAQYSRPILVYFRLQHSDTAESKEPIIKHKTRQHKLNSTMFEHKSEEGMELSILL